MTPVNPERIETQIHLDETWLSDVDLALDGNIQVLFSTSRPPLRSGKSVRHTDCFFYSEMKNKIAAFVERESMHCDILFPSKRMATSR